MSRPDPRPAPALGASGPWVACVAPLTFAAAVWLGRLTRVDATPLSLVWPAAAAGYLWLSWSASQGRLRRDAVLLGLTAAAVNAATGAGPALAVALGVANVVQALVAVLVVQRSSGDWRLRTSRHLAVLVGGSVAGAAAGALVGACSLAVLLGADLPTTFAASVVRNVGNTLVFAAVAVRLADLGWRSLSSGRRPAEWVGTIVALTGLYLLVFGAVHPYPMASFVLPLSVWVALRFSTTAVTGHVLLAGLFVVSVTGAGRGPFSAQPVLLRVMIAQAFVAILALVALVLALHRDERDRLMQALAAERDGHAEQHALLESVLDTVDVAVVACDAAGQLTLFNRAARRFHGGDVDPTADPEQWAAGFDLLAADGRTPLAPDRVPLTVALRDGRVQEQVITIAPHDLPSRVVRVDGRQLLDPDGRVLGAVVAQTDITRLQASEQEFRQAFLSGPTPSARLGEDGTLEHVNAALRRLLSLPSRLLVGRALAGLVAEADRAQLGRLLAGADDGPVEVRLLRADGSALWCEVSATPLHTAGADGWHRPGQRQLVQMLDVHDRRTREERLELAAERDPLTGLANRAVADARLAELAAQPEHRRTVLAYLDLDGFKQVNDGHGHHAGDAVLVATAERLLTVVRAGDDVVRLGGDEFLLICPVVSPSSTAATAAHAEQVAAALRRRVEALLSAPVRHAGQVLSVGASVGVLVVHGGEDPARLLARADQAMYERKRERKAVSAGRRTGDADAERRRLGALRGLDVLDTAPDPVLDELVHIAATVAGVPTALVSLVDEHRQWFKARCGTGLAETGRDVSFCAHVVAADGELHVPDATADPRFADNALVTGEPHLRSYAGFPLRTPDGHVLGSLCVIGYRPGTLGDAQRQVLRVLAASVAARLAPPAEPALPHPTDGRHDAAALAVPTA